MGLLSVYMGIKDDDGHSIRQYTIIESGTIDSLNSTLYISFLIEVYELFK